MKRYTETSTIYKRLSKYFFFIKGEEDNELHCFIKQQQKFIISFLKKHGVTVFDFRTVSIDNLSTDDIKELILRQQPTLDNETLEKKAKETKEAYCTKGKSKLLFINSCEENAEHIFEADILCEDDFGKPEDFDEKLYLFLKEIANINDEAQHLSTITYKLPLDEEDDDELQTEDYCECLCNDLLAESFCNSSNVEISPILFDDNFNISLPLYPQVSITLDPLPKALYILFLQHPEGIILKDIYMYENELKKIYSQISGRKNQTVINRMFRSLTDPTENPLHRNLSIIRRCFTSKLNYNIARNYIPAHGRKKVHSIPLESEYIILPGIA